MTYRDRYEMVLRAMPGTIHDIARQTGATVHSVDRWTQKLRKMGWAHVPEWTRLKGSGRMAPVIYGGPGESLPSQLEPITAEQSLYNYRQKLRRDRERYERVRAKENARKAIAKIVKSGRKASPFDALLM